MSIQPIRNLFPNTDNQEDGMNIMYIRIEPALLYLEAGQTSKIKVFAVLTDGRTEEITHKVKWQSQHTTIGKVNEEGTITAVEAGSMTIVAEFEQHKAELIVSIDKKAAAAKERKTGKIGKVGVITLAATLVIAGGAYGATQLFSSAESAPEQISQAPAEMVENSSETKQEEEPVGNSASILAEAEESPSVEGNTTDNAGMADAMGVETPTGEASAPAVIFPAGATAESPQTAAVAGGTTPLSTGSGTAVNPPTAPAKAAPATTKVEKPKQPAPTKQQTTTRQTANTQPVKTQPAKPVVVKPAAATTVVPQQKPPVAPDQPKSTATTNIMLVPVQKAGKWGYKRPGEDEVAIPYNFDHATKFSEGLALVKKDGKFGYINTQGKVVVPFVYSYATSFSGGKATVKKDGKLGTIDKSGSFNANQE